MKLSDYCKAHGGTAKLSCPVLVQLAEKIECSPGTLYQVALGKKSAGHKLANAIHKGTGGEVSRYTLRPEIFGLPDTEAANDA